MAILGSSKLFGIFSIHDFEVNVVLKIYGIFQGTVGPSSTKNSSLQKCYIFKFLGIKITRSCYFHISFFNKTHENIYLSNNIFREFVPTVVQKNVIDSSILYVLLDCRLCTFFCNILPIKLL